MKRQVGTWRGKKGINDDGETIERSKLRRVKKVRRRGKNRE